jgi:hypothetical protein
MAMKQWGLGLKMTIWKGGCFSLVFRFSSVVNFQKIWILTWVYFSDFAEIAEINLNSGDVNNWELPKKFLSNNVIKITITAINKKPQKFKFFYYNNLILKLFWNLISFQWIKGSIPRVDLFHHYWYQSMSRIGLDIHLNPFVFFCCPRGNVVV